MVTDTPAPTPFVDVRVIVPLQPKVTSPPVANAVSRLVSLQLLTTPPARLDDGWEATAATTTMNRATTTLTVGTFTEPRRIGASYSRDGLVVSRENRGHGPLGPELQTLRAASVRTRSFRCRVRLALCAGRRRPLRVRSHRAWPLSNGGKKVADEQVLVGPDWIRTSDLVDGERPTTV